MLTMTGKQYFVLCLREKPRNVILRLINYSISKCNRIYSILLKELCNFHVSEATRQIGGVVKPSRARAFVSTPSPRTIYPLEDVIWNGVRPTLSWAETSSPYSRRTCTASPDNARCNGFDLFLFGADTSPPPLRHA